MPAQIFHKPMSVIEIREAFRVVFFGRLTAAAKNALIEEFDLDDTKFALSDFLDGYDERLKKEKERRAERFSWRQYSEDDLWDLDILDSAVGVFLEALKDGCGPQDWPHGTKLRKKVLLNYPSTVGFLAQLRGKSCEHLSTSRINTLMSIKDMVNSWIDKGSPRRMRRTG